MPTDPLGCLKDSRRQNVLSVLSSCCSSSTFFFTPFFHSFVLSSPWEAGFLSFSVLYILRISNWPRCCTPRWSSLPSYWELHPQITTGHSLAYLVFANTVWLSNISVLDEENLTAVSRFAFEWILVWYPENCAFEVSTWI